ncbi:reprolysin-like metallopeptidase [Hymenobacter terrenus]|uniref:reprolysin-like metallopeptidase n=1 Tax=Hymenobacter terrenus TaxID=1629124 RepID=UPI000697826C|nr:zinc-dependent metalloprotease family protein [Hymenobacter terrenus]
MKTTHHFTLLLLPFLLLVQLGYAQSGGSLWQAVPAPVARGAEDKLKPASWFRLNEAQLMARLASVPPETRPTEAVTLDLPFPDGTLHRFAITQVPVMAPALAARYPQIRAYAGRGIDVATSVRLEISPVGLHAQVFIPSGSLSLAADPAAPNLYQSRADATVDFACQALPAPGRAKRLTGLPASPPDPYGRELRTLRLALAATGEFYQNPGFGNGSLVGTMAQMVTLVNTVNAVYERELSLRLQLIANNDLLIYPDAATDPYDNSNPKSLMDTNMTSIDGIVGAANYDLGHVLGYRSGGYSGIAYTGVVCVPGWAGGGASTGNSPGLMATVVTHELGHQLGAEHTFNSDQGNCAGGTRQPYSAYEPGAGNTIMSYDSRCAPDDVGPGINYFHAGSLSAIIPDLTCGTLTPTDNQPPSVSVPSIRYTIPIGTPFALAGSGTDPDGDALTYSWEELDRGNPSGLAGAATDVSGPPLFRSFAPVASPVRTFPVLQSILDNTVSLGEILPKVARPLNFRFTARDNRSGGGGVAGVNLRMAVAAAGPFKVTAPSRAFTAASNSLYTVTWSVLGTDLPPVNCTDVQILFSTDGGLTFPIVLLASTPNDGTAQVQLPNVATTKGRLKIQALNNVFFAINNANLTLTGTPLPVELTAFSADARHTTAHLTWTTASEKNSAGFAVEASSDGSNFHRLGWVAGQGERSIPTSYAFDDAALATYPGPTVYYRLRQIDQDGSEAFSPVRAVPVPIGLASHLEVWPNPARGTVAVAGLPPGESVQLLDFTGRVLRTAALPATGPLQLELPASLVPGLYLVRGGGQARQLAVE